MLKQFNVYRNPSSATNKQLPYYMIVQHDYYDELNTRTIVPLIRYRQIPFWYQQVSPGINIDFESFNLYSPMITNLEIGKINRRDFVCHLPLARNDVITALDALITNS